MPNQLSGWTLQGPPLPLMMSILLIISSAIVMCGWIFSIETLKRPLMGLITIKVNTAMTFFFCGLALLCSLRGANRLAKFFAVIITTIGALTFYENLTGHNLGIDQILALDPTFMNGLPGRMAQHSALSFLAVGLAIIFSDRRLFRTTPIEAAGYFVSLIGLISLVGYAYEVPSLYHPALLVGLQGFTGMSLTASILFIVLGTNLLALKQAYWFASLWTSDSHGGELIRTFIPLFIGLPIALGFAKTYLQNVGIVNNEVAVTIIVITMVAGSVIVTTRLAARFDKIDAERVKNDHQKQDLLYALAHDMKIPLIGSDKMLELIISGQFSDIEVQKSYLLLVKQSNETLLWMIQNLIYENQRERGLEQITQTPTNLSDLTSKCVAQIQSFATSKDITVHCHLNPDLIADLDPEAIKLVLINVLHNAVKFTNHGTITILSIEEEDAIIIEISDTGVGISSENQERIFQRIWQSEANRRTSTGGTGSGLGLHLCRHIMEAHGGQITHKNRVGGGSVFSLSFPYKRLNSAPPPSQEPHVKPEIA